MRVLDHLNYWQMVARQQDVAVAYNATFQWLFSNSGTGDKPCDDFLRWLQEGSGCYRINGKAGSGKPTLMKYIINRSTTRLALRF